MTDNDRLRAQIPRLVEMFISLDIPFKDYDEMLKQFALVVECYRITDANAKRDKEIKLKEQQAFAKQIQKRVIQ